jgi:hypothetical protein
MNPIFSGIILLTEVFIKNFDNDCKLALKLMKHLQIKVLDICFFSKTQINVDVDCEVT